jgi:surface polysaccharide O-acyltransferase-like enzyme
VLITVMTQLRAPETVGLGDLWKAFTPVKEAKYLYFNAYVGLFFFIPLLNHAIRSISGREAVFAMVGIFLLVLWLPNTRLSEVFLLANGYSALWLVILYALGGLMARFELPGKLPAKFWALGYLLAVLGSFVPRMVMLAMKPELWSPANSNLSMQYINLCVILAGICLVGLFSRLELPEKLIPTVKALSPHAFGVFLFHTHTLVFLTAIRGRFAWLGTAPLWELLGVLLGATAFIYILGTVVDWLIDRAMAITRLDRLLKLPDRLIDRI